MVDWAGLLHIYRTFDAAGAVALHRSLSPLVGLALASVGVAALLFGNGPFFRFLAGPLAGIAGAVWLPAVLARAGLQAETLSFAASAGGALFILGLLAPPFALFFFVGLPLGVVAGNFAGEGSFLLGFTPTFVVTGTLAAMFLSPISAVASSALGGWLLAWGGLAVLGPSWPALAEGATRRSGFVVLLGAFLATAGALYQIVLRRTPEELRLRRIERARAKRRLQEKRAQP